MSSRLFRTQVISTFEDHWRNAQDKYRLEAVSYFTTLYDRFCSEGLADPIFETELTSGDPSRYAQRVAEMMLADHLWRAGFTLSSAAEGPDLKAQKNGKSVWLELVTPTPKDIDPDYLKLPVPGEVGPAHNVPHAEQALRWTAGIVEKSRKLLGHAERCKKGYLQKGIVRSDESYVIVVNSQLLDAFHFTINGVSQTPFPVEMVFAVGPMAVAINPASMEVEWSGHMQRRAIPKPDAESVPSDLFLHPESGPISGLLGIDLYEPVIWGKEHPSAMVYNPYATNPIDLALIPAMEHWGAIIDDSGYRVNRLDAAKK